MATKTDKTQLVELVLSGVNTIVERILRSYVSVNVARLKADVFASAYSAHLVRGQLPEEARSSALATAEFMAKTVEG